MPQQTIDAVLLREPAEEAGKEARVAFDDEIAAAMKGGQQIIVHTAGKEPYRRIPGVIYESESFHALMALLANSAATNGHSNNKLSQIISDAQGIPMPVVHEVPDHG